MAVGEDCQASLEIVGRPNIYIMPRIVFPLPRLQRDPQLVEVRRVQGKDRQRGGRLEQG